MERSDMDRSDSRRAPKGDRRTARSKGTEVTQVFLSHTHCCSYFHHSDSLCPLCFSVLCGFLARILGVNFGIQVKWDIRSAETGGEPSNRLIIKRIFIYFMRKILLSPAIIHAL